MIHRFRHDISTLELPLEFNNPFEPNASEIATIAASELKDHIKTYPQWQEELMRGKMFGVLVVRDGGGQLGYLTAFSATLDGKNFHHGFVHPIYDMLDDEGYFRQEERSISLINREIEVLENGSDFVAAKDNLSQYLSCSSGEIAEAKLALKEAKRRRDALRSSRSLSAEQYSELIRESQFQKAQLKRLEQKIEKERERLQAIVSPVQNIIADLSNERKIRSAALQEWLFDHYIIVNGRGDKSSLTAIFSSTPQRKPPAGAGECAAPKLLNYAFLNGLKPLAIAEFWWGESPQGEVRKHGKFYGACKGKCHPILTYMLQGIEVETCCRNRVFSDIEILYEDSCISVFDKPSGMLSEDGLNGSESLMGYIKRVYGYTPYSVHRLDMDTSGVIIVAKDIESKKQLQSQFANHTIYKEYEAVLEGELKTKSGIITLPLSSDYINRPLQRVDYSSGKRAQTYYEVVGVNRGRTRILFKPTTGRTHQLRLHSAHKDGLYSPIVGDNLYGESDIRLHLHAKMVRFIHPQNGELIEIDSVVPF